MSSLKGRSSAALDKKVEFFFSFYNRGEKLQHNSEYYNPHTWKDFR